MTNMERDMKRVIILSVSVFFLSMMYSIAVFAEPADSWTCHNCGKETDGSFCNNCGQPKSGADWICPTCGQTVSGQYCNFCGTAKSEEETSATEVNGDETIHRYEYYLEDCSWSDAFQKAKEKGGYLVRINSREEYDHILSEIVQNGMSDKKFFIGARRNVEEQEYHWVDEDNTTYGEILNSPDYWASAEWLEGEPSYTDGATSEVCLDIFYYADKNAWVWNDVPNDILTTAPYYSGTIGYIVEFNDNKMEEVNSDNIKNTEIYDSILEEYRNAAAAFPTDQDWELLKQQYPNVDTMIIFNQYSSPESIGIYYTYYDIDGNGVDELLISEGGIDGSYMTCCDVFSNDGISPISFFSDYSLGYRSRLTIYTDGTMGIEGSNGAADGAVESWVIADDGFTPVMTIKYSYHYSEDGSISYADVVGEITPEEYINSLDNKSEIKITNWMAI